MVRITKTETKISIDHLSVRYEDDGTETVLAGPALYWNFNDTVHMRLEWKHDFHDRQGTLDHGNGDRLLLSLGLVF